MSKLLKQHFQQYFMRTLGLMMLGVAYFGIIACSPNQSAMAQTKSEKPTGSSHRSHRAAGIKAIPFSKINATAQRRIKDVVNRPSFYRRLPVQTIDADPEYFRLLVRRPELIVSIWQLMGVTQMSTERTGPFTVKTNDGAGTISDLELVYGNDKLHVFYGNGSYTGPLLKQKLTGRCVIVLQTQATETSSGFNLTNVLDIYLKVDSATASLITRTIQPLVGTTADHNFSESLKFVQRLNQSTRLNGPGVKGMGRKLDIDNQVRKNFEVVVDKVYARASKKSQQAKLGKPTSPPIAKTQQATPRRTAKPSTAQVSPQISQRVQVTKPALSAPPSQINHQPLVSPSLAGQTAQAVQAVQAVQANSGSPRKFVRAADSSSPALSPAAAVAPEAAVQAKLTLSDGVTRQGISVLVGGPRDLNETAALPVSVADRTNITNPEFDPKRFPKRSSQR